MGRIELTAEKFAELFGGKPVVDEGDDPEFMRILQRFIFGEVFYTGDLDDQTRELITVSVLTANQTLPQLTVHTRAALAAGCAPVEIREAVYQCAPLIGFPKTLNAISAMNEAFRGKGIALPLPAQGTVADDDRQRMGRCFQEPIYGRELARQYSDLPGEFAEALPRFVTELTFGDFASRNGLDRRRRELLTFVVLAALGDAEPQVRSHAVGAVKAGNTVEGLLAALLQAMPYAGVPRILNAVNAIAPVLSDVS